MSGRKSGKTFPSKLDNFSSHWDLHFRQNVKWSRDKQRERKGENLRNRFEILYWQ